MSTTDLGWPLVIALVALVVLTVAVSVFARLRLGGSVVVASLRAVLQLGLVSLIIAATLSHLALASLFGVVMFAVAVFTSAKRCGVLDRWWWVALAMAAGVLPVLAIIFASGASPLTGAALIPIAGIIIGNAMTGHTLIARRAFNALRDNHPAYEAGLAIGLTRPETIGEITGPTRVEALVPGIDATRTVGLVTLPGAFVGVLLGGGTPIQAGAAQLLVLFGISAAQFLCVIVAERLIAQAKLLPEDLRAALRP